MDNEYELRYLPLFYEDMYEKITYIREKLLNPEAADALIDAVEEAILERLPNCESFEPYHSVKEREYPYYRIYVKNFTVYYVVIHMDDRKIMEVWKHMIWQSSDRFCLSQEKNRSGLRHCHPNCRRNC